MKSFIGLAVTMLASASMSWAQDVEKETDLQEVEVTSLRATSKTPVAHSNLNREQIEVPSCSPLCQALPPQQMQATASVTQAFGCVAQTLRASM